MAKAKVTVPGAKKKVTRPVKEKGPRPAKSYRRHRRFDVADVLPAVKKRPRGKPFQAGNPWRFPAGVAPNPGGRPKLLGESYAQLLAQHDPRTGKTFAELAAEKMFEMFMAGEVAAAREMRQATEGDTMHTPDAGIQVVIDR